MTRKEAIIARRAIRTYTEEPLKDNQLADLRQFIGTVKPLHSSIKTSISILSREDFVRNFKSILAPHAQHYLVIRSVKKDGYLENAGFIGEQIVLYLVEHEIGTCWIGCTAPKNAEEPGLFPYVITICFGRPDNAPRRLNAEEAKRKLLHEIVMGKISNPSLLPLLEAGRLAPSAMNMQPVRYITESSNIFVYRKRPLFNISALERMQRIDVGVALANIYVADGGERIFIREKNYPTPQGNCEYEYTALDAAALELDDDSDGDI
ncbi:MAG: hypothetical protein IJP17_00635 [Clostridia bacterium]|nr:hypothetical protein [Clostridia bacterium]